MCSSCSFQDAPSFLSVGNENFSHFKSRLHSPRIFYLIYLCSPLRLIAQTAAVLRPAPIFNVLLSFVSRAMHFRDIALRYLNISGHKIAKVQPSTEFSAGLVNHYLGNITLLVVMLSFPTQRHSLRDAAQVLEPTKSTGWSSFSFYLWRSWVCNGECSTATGFHSVGSECLTFGIFRWYCGLYFRIFCQVTESARKTDLLPGWGFVLNSLPIASRVLFVPRSCYALQLLDVG